MYDMVQAARAVDQFLDNQMASLEELGALSDKLGEQADHTELSVAQLRAAVSAAVADSDGVAVVETLLNHAVNPLSEIAQWLVGAMEDLHDNLNDVRRRIGDLQVRIALTWLHDEQLGEFARELAVGEAPERAPAYINRLAQALEETATAVSHEIVGTNERLRVFLQDLDEVEHMMHGFQHQLARHLLIPRLGLSRHLDPFAGPIDDYLSSGLKQVVTVRHIANQCLAASKPFDARPIAAALQAVWVAREMVNELAVPTPPRGTRVHGLE
jgi:ABC-type transporter Mla subunit MlaD